MSKRSYFYFLNERGNLYHIFDVERYRAGTCAAPSGPTFLRDPKFLDFFTRNMRCTSLRHAGGDAQLAQQFPFVSLCGSELNFLATIDSPVVFHDLEVADDRAGSAIGVLRFGGTLSQPFDPTALRVSRTGKLFHPVTALTKFTESIAEMHASHSCVRHDRGAVLGLVGSQVGLTLGFEFICEDQSDAGLWEIEWGSLGRVPILPLVD